MGAKTIAPTDLFSPETKLGAQSSREFSSARDATIKRAFAKGPLHAKARGPKMRRVEIPQAPAQPFLVGRISGCSEPDELPGPLLSRVVGDKARECLQEHAPTERRLIV